MKARKTLNKALLRKVALKLRRLRHEEHFNQGEWIQKTSCGTAACVAGHAALEAGWRPVFSPEYDDFADAKRNGRICRDGIGEVGSRELGLPLCHWLFDCNPGYAWPGQFAVRWREAESGDPRAERPSRIAADLLDAIADGKVKL